VKQRHTRKERKVRERKETATKEEKSVSEREKERERRREREISVWEAMFAVTDDLILSDMSQAHRGCMRQDRLPLHSPDACQVRPDPAA
jgi:hypothetical protein